MTAPVLLAALLAVQAAAPAPDWVPLGQDNTARYQYDRANVRREGDVVYFTIYATALAQRSSGFAAFMARHSIDCTRGTMLIVGLTGYDAAGTATFSRDNPPGERPEVPMTPGSPQARARDQLCAAAAPGEGARQ